MSDNLHKLHLKTLAKTDSKVVSFVEDIENIKINTNQNDKIRSILSDKNLNYLLEQNKDSELIELFSLLNMGNIQSFINKVEKIDPKKIQKLTKNINLLSSGNDNIENMIERILVIYRMTLIKKIFSDDKLNDCINVIKNYK